MLIDEIRSQLTAATKAKDADRLRVLRSVLAAVQEAEVAGSEATTLDDAGIQKVLAAQIKRRADAAEAYDEGDRGDRAATERAEIAVIEEFLPAALSDEELDAVIDAVFAEGGFDGPKAMGPAMKAVNGALASQDLSSRVEGRRVADAVKSRLA
ncbi:MAG: GatB/YqeY domain-containing protein [Actinomycetota bacterium]